MLAKPSISVSTPTIYKELQVDNVEHPDTQKMIESIKNGDLDGIFASTGNVLESVTLEKIRKLNE